MAYYDEMGNGNTSVDDGHSHSIRAFIVAPHQTPDGGKMHEHPGVLERPESTSGAEYMDWTGQVNPGGPGGSTYGESMVEMDKVVKIGDYSSSMDKQIDKVLEPVNGGQSVAADDCWVVNDLNKALKLLSDAGIQAKHNPIRGET
jgi:hypothetical protein